MYEISNGNSKVKEFVSKFDSKLEQLLKVESLSPTDTICVIANLNLQGRDIPSNIFRHINYDGECDGPDDKLILAESLKRIKNGKVEIDRPVRTDVGPCQLQYNFLRGFRPKRAARLVDIALDKPFDSKSFHFSPPGVWAGEFDTVNHDGTVVQLTYNLYPFAPYHFLWLPNTKELHNQFFDPKKDRHYIEAAWDFVKEHGENVWLSYNALGAHASVNHLHLQGFLTTDDWEPPFAKTLREHKGGATIESFVPGAKYIPPERAVDGLCEFISEMNERWEQRKDNSYHFCMNSKGVVCFPRKRQGDKDYFSLLEKASFTTGYAFFEALGEIICPAKEISVFDKYLIEKQASGLYTAMELRR